MTDLIYSISKGSQEKRSLQHPVIIIKLENQKLPLEHPLACDIIQKNKQFV